MKQKLTLAAIIAMNIFLAGLVTSCSTANNDEPDSPVEPVKPEEPIETGDQIVTLSIGCNIPTDDFSNLKARSESQGDLFGVNVEMLEKESSNTNYTPYAAGVFDDLDKIQFKFVKGRTYRITVNYTPDAKSFISKNKNGTYGYPFSSVYGLDDYEINEPVYDEGGSNTGGYLGVSLTYLGEAGYQSNASGIFNDSYKQGSTKRYLGCVDNFMIGEASSVTVPLKLYTSGIKLNVGNFDSGKIKLIIPSGAPNNAELYYNPGDDMTQLFWIQGLFSEEGLIPWAGKLFRIYYISDNNETFLLCTKSIECQPATMYVFNFNLSEREDGSIGISIDDQMSEENVEL